MIIRKKNLGYQKCVTYLYVIVRVKVRQKISNKVRNSGTEKNGKRKSSESASEKAFAKFEKTKSDSLLKKHLSHKIFEMIKDKQTKFGSGVLEAIQSGLKNPDSGVDIYAPDPELMASFAKSLIRLSNTSMAVF